MVLSQKKIHDILALLLWTFIATILQLFIFQPSGPSVPTFLYFVLPTLYLIFKYKPYRKAVLAGTLLTGILIPLPFDFLIHLNESWFVPLDKLLLPTKLFGFYPVDELLWFTLLALYTIVFYEVFVDGGRKFKLSTNFKPAVCLWLFTNIVVLFLIVFWKDYLLLPFSYLFIVAPLSLPPILYVFFKKPYLVKKFLLPTAFFFFVSINFEIVGLTFGHWVFADDYIGWVSVFGRYFPFEEFFYWMLLYPATVLSYYELLVDNGR